MNKKIAASQPKRSKKSKNPPGCAPSHPKMGGWHPTKVAGRFNCSLIFPASKPVHPRRRKWFCHAKLVPQPTPAKPLKKTQRTI